MRRARLSTSPTVVCVLALLMLVLAFAWGASSARAESWGEVKQFKMTPGEAVGQVSKNHLVRFAAGSDGSYYVLTGNTSTGEFDLQRFDEGTKQAEQSFDRPKEEEETDKVGTEGVNATLAVDPAHDRVYVLLVYERRAVNEKEEEKEEKVGHPVFPLDEEMPATGSLFAFEYSSTKKELVSKESKGTPIPQLTRNDLHGQGEEAKEALLDPRGMAVDPANGDLVISGNQDEESNEEVELGTAEKQCRAALQFVSVESNGAAEEIKKLSPTARYVDKEGKVLFGNVGPGHGCGEEEEEEAGVMAPASPVFAPDGSVLGYGEDESVGPEGVIWQLAPAGADVQAAGEDPMTPKELFVAESLPAFSASTGHETPVSVMSMVDEGSTSGTLYLSGEYAANSQPAPAVLHYSHPVPGEPSISEVGWTAGGTENENLGPEPCDLHKLPTGTGGTLAVGGVSIAGKRGLLALTYYTEYVGAGHEKEEQRAEVVQFGEGGSTKGCPTPNVTTPAQSFHGVLTNEIPLGESTEVISVIGKPSAPAAAAKSVKWTVKFNGAVLEEHEEAFEHNGLHEEEEGYGFILGRQQKFNKEGTYEITVVVHSDDLADEVVQPAVADNVTVKGAKLVLNPKTPEPGKIAAHEGEAKLAVEVKEEPNEGPLKITHVVWEFREGPKAEQSEPPETLSSPVHIEHEFGRCGTAATTKCKIKVTVDAESATGKKLTATSENMEITVEENATEKAAEAAENAKKQKEVEEAAETAANQKKAEEKHNEEVAAEAAGKKKAEEEAAKKKAEEEAANAKGGVAGYIASFSGSSLSVSSSGSLTVTITCPSGGSCSGSLMLQTASAVAASSKKHARKKVLTLASGSFSLSGESRSVTLHLSSTGRAVLSSAHGKLAAKLTIVSDGTGGQKNSVVSHIVTLRQAAKKSHK